MSILGQRERTSIQSCDVGSLPYSGDLKRLHESAHHLCTNSQDASAGLFENTIVDAFIDKLKAGIQVAAFPQFRDMNDMFISALAGLQKVKGGYVEVDHVSLKSGFSKLPEVIAIEKNVKKIADSTGIPFQMRICITGPYTLGSFFPYRTSQTYARLGALLSEIIEDNVFATKEGRVTLVSIDEPLFGFVDDPLIDKGTEGRESLLKAWTTMTSRVKTRKAQSCIHLHSTSDDLFWEIDLLNMIESHVADPLYEMGNTRRLLDRKDKQLKASVAKTDFDQLIRESLGTKASDSSIADVWYKLSRGELKPETFLESTATMKKRLVEIINRFGEDRVVLAGPECGLRGFPSYSSAIDCLRNASLAVVST
jgi:5-methyltetrahydropteroyltriglutamate--homocysteine methyltransferase